jgi:selT/selW/selH-like putative selenoprotein
MGGESILRLLGYQNQMPGFYFTIQKYSMQFGIFLFLILPQFLAKWRISGAFEIYLDGEEIFSKISTGALPKGDDLLDMMVSAGFTPAKAS